MMSVFHHCKLILRQHGIVSDTICAAYIWVFMVKLAVDDAALLNQI